MIPAMLCGEDYQSTSYQLECNAPFTHLNNSQVTIYKSLSLFKSALGSYAMNQTKQQNENDTKNIQLQ